MIELLKASHYKKMRWKNGEGYTLEIARSVGESLAEFDWRISMADVKTSGDFSKFNGMNRFLTVLEGQGLSLRIDDDFKHLKTLQSVEFGGDSVVSCELLAGHIRDFNLIYNPKKFDAQYQWIFSPEALEIPISSDVMFIFNQSVEALVIEIGQQIFHLEHQDSLKLEDEKSLKTIILNQQFLKQTCLIQLTKI